MYIAFRFYQFMDTNCLHHKISFSGNISLAFIYYILRITEFIEMFFKDKILR